MTVEELASRTGVSVRNIRAYQTAGLMPPPRLQGRLGLYDPEHQGKLELIRDLRQWSSVPVIVLLWPLANSLGSAVREAPSAALSWGEPAAQAWP